MNYVLAMYSPVPALIHLIPFHATVVTGGFSSQRPGVMPLCGLGLEQEYWQVVEAQSPRVDVSAWYVGNKCPSSHVSGG